MYILAFPADIGRAVGDGYADHTLTRRRKPASPTKPTHRLMKRPTAQHGGTRMKHQHQMLDNLSD